ncbi:hypothetical protein BKA82DRAFT_4019118 [Pisolithus tinctorius]|nr:hypothetical protein BKA82DRAFT_4019118 [Pisolithus tinctorius]
MNMATTAADWHVCVSEWAMSSWKISTANTTGLPHLFHVSHPRRRTELTNRTRNTFSMARMQSKKHRRLLDFGKPPGSAPSHLTPQGPSRAPPEDPTLDMETASSVPKGGLAKIKRFFHRKIQSHQTTATERAHTNTDVGPQEQMEQSPAPGTEDVRHL